MDSRHPDSAAVDRIGTQAIMDHFEITRQSVFHWRVAGVPKQYRKAMILLGKELGHEMPEMSEPRAKLAA